MLRNLPAVERVLQALGSQELPRPLVVALVRERLADCRRRGTVPDFAGLLLAVRQDLKRVSSARLKPVINGTGILIHTNLGRSPLGPAVCAAIGAAASNYVNLEYDLTEGSRGARASYLERLLALLCHSEAATVVNNCAAALLLMLRHVLDGARNEVVVSRGELVQIGGGFRIPEILESSGAKLREVGTTNKTRLEDYRSAVGPRTALILKVHQSNFFMDGFVETVPTADLALLAKRKRIPFFEDLGSGAAISTERVYPLTHEPTAAEVLRQGVELVCFSGDKLFGGPQAGIIAGRKKRIAALKRVPMFRAMRCDKLVLAALQSVVEVYLEQDRSARAGRAEPGSEEGGVGREIPLLAMLTASEDDLRKRAEMIVEKLAGLPVSTRIGKSVGQLGGGTLPRSEVPSITIEMLPREIALEELARRMRMGDPPVIGYNSGGKFKIDLRTVFPRQDETVIEAIRAALAT